MTRARFRPGLLPALACAALACSNGGGSDGDGSAISRGVITRLGGPAVHVAGVAWAADGEIVDLDGMTALPAALQVGMVVTIRGDRSGDTGTAESIGYDPNLRGPIEALDVTTDLDGDVRRVTFEILGKPVVAAPGATLVDDDPPLDLGALVEGVVVEVSGLRDPDGAIQATRIEALGSLADVEVEGIVEDLDEGLGRFSVDGLVVGFDPAGVDTDLSAMPGGVVVEGDFVEVRGSYDGGADPPLDATAPGIGAIGLVETAFAGGADSLAVEGIVGRFFSLADFEVGGQEVDAARDLPAFEPGSSSFVGDGAWVQVDGRLQSSVLVARSVRWRDANAGLQAVVPVDGVDASEETLDLLEVRVRADGATRFEDAGDPTFDAFEDVLEGDLLAVRGVQTDDDEVRAFEVTRLPLPGGPAPVLLRARVQGFSDTVPPRSFTLLGAEVVTDVLGTAFESPDMEFDDENGFYLFLAANPQAFVEAEDGDGHTAIGVADEVEWLDPLD